MSDDDQHFEAGQDFSQSYDSDDEKIEAFHDLINEENFWNYMDTAKRYVAEKKYSDAFILLRAIILKGTEIFGSQAHVNLAAAYFEMGNGMLEMAEQNPQNFLSQPAEAQDTQALLDQVDQAKQMAIKLIPQEESKALPLAEEELARTLGLEEQAKDNQNSGDQKKPEEIEKAEDEGEEGGEEEEEVDDIGVAWENLDVARTILEKYLRDQPNLDPKDVYRFKSQLANANLRLGDLKSWQENYSEALIEYERCLGILVQIEDPTFSRRVAEVNFLIGNTHLYNFGKDKEGLEKSLFYYKAGRETIKNVRDRSKGEEAAELSDIFEAMTLKIAEVEEELKSKDQIVIELEKINELKEKKNEGFAKSQFDPAETRKIGKFCAGKKLPDAEAPSESRKKVNLGSEQPENDKPE